MFMPTSYGDPAAEYDRLVNGVAMWDVAVERQVALKGPDAQKLARLLTPRNLDGLVIGQGKYVPICNYDGVIINDPVLLQVDEDEIWLSIADSDIVLWASAIAVRTGWMCGCLNRMCHHWPFRDQNRLMLSPIYLAIGSES